MIVMKDSVLQQVRAHSTWLLVSVAAAGIGGAAYISVRSSSFWGNFAAELFGILVGAAVTVLVLDWVQQTRYQRHLGPIRSALHTQIGFVLSAWIVRLAHNHDENSVGKCALTVHGDETFLDLRSNIVSFLIHLRTGCANPGSWDHDDGWIEEFRTLLLQAAPLADADPEAIAEIARWLVAADFAQLTAASRESQQRDGHAAFVQLLDATEELVQRFWMDTETGTRG